MFVSASWRCPGFSLFLRVGCSLVLLALVVSGLPAQAHHLIEINGLQPTLFNGLISGIAHPVLGPDHLLFLLALCLLGLKRRLRWTLALLAIGLAGSLIGLVLPGLSLAEPLVAATLTVEAFVLLGVLPSALLVPAMALHGYVLSSSVLGWSAMPLATYMVGLVFSQALLLSVALGLLRGVHARLSLSARRWGALILMGLSLALGLASTLA